MNLSLFDMAGDTPLLNPEIVEQVAAINSVIEAKATARVVKIDALRTAAIEFASLLGHRTKLTWDRAAEVMTRHLNGTDADGAWTPQDLYNAAESGLVRTIVTRPLPTDATRLLEELDGLDSLMPPRRRRSEEGIRLQQFSTPSPYAWLANVAAGVTAHDIVLEPSAGTGLLAVFATIAGAKLVVNELDSDRLGLLDHLDAIAATDHDARYLSALYRGEKPTVVVMNPPFSIDHNLGSDRRVRALALSHVDQAMRTVRRGGRVVAIVGHNQSPAEHSDLWDDILTRATVRAAIAIDGNAYKHMGTTFGTAIVVLDATLDVQKPVFYKSPVSLEEAYSILADVVPRTNLLEGATRHAGGQVVSLEGVRTRTDNVAAFAFREKPEPVVYAIRDDIDAMHEDGRYAHYAPQTIQIADATPHPTPLVESAALACVRPPIPTYVPLLPSSLIRTGVLSEAQLEVVIYAGDAHQKSLEVIEEDDDHQRVSSIVARGWMNGAGTGVGKGRAQPLSAKILTPTGWTTMGEIAVGDKVLTPSGDVATVSQLHPQGPQAIYRLMMSDGSSAECTDDHLWMTETRRQRHYLKGERTSKAPLKRRTVRTTSELRRDLSKIHSLPLVDGLPFEPRDVPLSPYVLGVLLADGCIRETSVEFVTADAEILNTVSAELPPGLVPHKVPSRDYHYYITRPKSQKRTRRSVLPAIMRGLRLTGCVANSKFIPDDYKFNTVANRLALLQGLMDCDGCAEKTGNAAYYTVSKRLADDVVFLVESLGGTTSVRVKTTPKQPCFAITIRLPEGLAPFRLARKLERVPKRWVKYPPRRYIKKIEYVGVEDAQCITISDPLHLYITDRFIVTHNCNAAIIADNFARGRTKAIWFSESPTLEEDARRDWRALTGDENAIFSLSGVPVDMRLERSHGILFCTYATLRSKSKKSTRSRVEQIIEWVGEDFDGALIFDESHNLANAVPAKSEDGALKALQSGSLQGMAALELQRHLPLARIVYVSATSASKIDALAYAPRLGLWGIGTAFPTREQFLSTMGSGGTAAFELLCRDMKALGFYLSASLSYDGVTYERLIHKLDDDQQGQFNVVAGAWRMILANVHAALKSSNASALAKAAALSGLESTRLRSLQAVTVSQKVPTLLIDAERELEAGHSVVIQLTNTNEAIQERALAKLGDEGDLDEVNLSGAEIMLDFVDRCFPTQMYHDRLTEDGNVVTEPLLDGDGSPVQNPEALAMRDELKTMIATVLAPVGPIEMILDHFGPDAVGEITGRSRRIVMRSVNGHLQRVLEERGAHANLAEMQAFRDGKKRILIFSEGAGGTGFSYHADRAAANQQKRIHYLLQTGYRSDRALQGMGRTHRTNQACAPCYKLVCTDIPGEMRFISVIARRLESLGALTRGQRDAASGGIFDPSDNLETTWGELAVGALLRTIATKGIEGLNYAQWVAQTGLALFTADDKIKAEQIPVSRFLNRVLCCDLGPNGGIQGLIMDALMEQLEATIDAAKQSGKFDHGIQTIPALSLKKVSENIVHRHDESGCTTSVIEIEAQVPREAKTFGQVVSYVRRAREKHGHASAFFFQHPEYGIACCYPTAATRQERNRVIPLAKVITPLHQSNIDQAFTNGFVRSVVDDADAEAAWKTALEEGGDTVTQHYTMIAGTLLPIYDRLPDDNPIVYRLTLDDGERLIGRVISEEQRAGTLARLGVEAKADPARAYAVAKSGARVALANGWVIKVSRLNGTPRLELIVPSHQIMRVKSGLTARGLIAETVAYAMRFFIPTGADEPAIFHKLIDDLSLAA